MQFLKLNPFAILRMIFQVTDRKFIFLKFGWPLFKLSLKRLVIFLFFFVQGDQQRNVYLQHWAPLNDKFSQKSSQVQFFITSIVTFSKVSVISNFCDVNRVSSKIYICILHFCYIFIICLLFITFYLEKDKIKTRIKFLFSEKIPYFRQNIYFFLYTQNNKNIYHKRSICVTKLQNHKIFVFFLFN